MHISCTVCWLCIDSVEKMKRKPHIILCLSAWIKMWFSNAITLNCSSIIRLGSGNSFRGLNPLWSWGMAESSFHLSRFILILMLIFKRYGYLFISKTGNVAIKSGRRLKVALWLSSQTPHLSVHADKPNLSDPQWPSLAMWV